MMKKTFFTLGLAAILVLGARTSVQASTGDIWLTPATLTSSGGQTFDLQLHIDGSGTSIGAISGYLDFDPAKVALIDTGSPIGNGTQTGYNFMYNDDNKAAGSLRFSGICAQGCANSADSHLLTFHLRLLAAFDQGSTNVTLRVNELSNDLGVSLAVGAVSGTVVSSPVVADTISAVRSNGSPVGVLAAGIGQATLSLTTNEAATCRYSSVINTPYTSMTGSFATTGGLSHSTTLTGLADGASYSYFVRCVDAAGNVNADDYLVSFSVAQPADIYPAVRSNGSPSGNLAAGATQATISLTTNEAATCKYSTVANTPYSSMTGTFSTTGAGTHSTLVSGLSGGNTYTYYVRCVDVVGNVNTDDYAIKFSVPTVVITPTYLIVTFKSSTVYTRFKGKILLKVEDAGKAYYISMLQNRGYYMADGAGALSVMSSQGVGITNADLAKIPMGTGIMVGTDTDGDGLSDSFENAIGTDINKADTDGDGFSDRTEIETGNNPLGTGKLPINTTFAKKQNGKIFLQTEKNGQAWYIYGGKRYYMGKPEEAMEVMKKLSTGITNYDFNRYLVEVK